MAHSFLNPEVIARASLSALRNRTIMSGLVWRNAETEYGGGTGDTLTIRRPPTFTPKLFDRSRGIEPQDITEYGIKISLDDIYDISVVLTDEEVLLDLRSMSEQVITPSMTGIADAMDQLVISTLDGLPTELSWDDNDVLLTFSEARMRMNRMGVPQAGRTMVLSPESAKRLLDNDIIRRADASGNGGQALREAFIGRIMGFDVYEYSKVPGTDVGYAFHREVMALASRSLSNPTAGASASGQSFEGWAIRVIEGYELRTKQRIVSFDTLVGTDLINHASNPDADTLHLGLRITPADAAPSTLAAPASTSGRTTRKKAA
ncbi:MULTISPECIES: P22 phage major capsid protein family protein [unclassified Nocardiopsis]|uniref:P22 phage major capsid protein family protein n=1 Tax=unclassified Nocardiopsis TaxID=2649073 RepID=UPI00135A1311|nr:MULTISPECIES: P22 phage major capsid protein family protein [unclassified Nocardiopsis]